MSKALLRKQKAILSGDKRHMEGLLIFCAPRNIGFCQYSHKLWC